MGTLAPHMSNNHPAVDELLQGDGGRRRDRYKRGGDREEEGVRHPHWMRASIKSSDNVTSTRLGRGKTRGMTGNVAVWLPAGLGVGLLCVTCASAEISGDSGVADGSST